MALEFNIVKSICVLSERDDWTKEINVVSWNHRETTLYMALHNYVNER